MRRAFVHCGLLMLTLLLVAATATTVPTRRVHFRPPTAPGYDSDAQTFINACATAGHALTTGEQDAVNTLVLHLKTGTVNGTDNWTGSIAIYPMVGGAASSHAINLRNPGTFDLSFVNSPTHDANGVDWNGSTQYADTGISPSTHMTLDDCVWVYCTNENDSGTLYDLGAYDSGTSQLLAYSDGGLYYSYMWSSASLTGGTPSSFAGNFIGPRVSSSDSRVYRGTTQLGSTATGSSGSLPSNNIYLGTWNLAGSPFGYTTRRCQGAMFGDGRTADQVADLDAAWTTFNTTGLSR